MAWSSDDYIELTGISFGRRGKAIYFQADYWDAPEYLPASQCDFTADPNSDEDGRGVMRIPGWLAKKNGWSE